MGRELRDTYSPGQMPLSPDLVARSLDPLFRWPGGKRWLVPRLLSLSAVGFEKYYEPFFGAGALFFALRPASAAISDRNHELMACYRAVRQDYESVAEALARLPRDRETFDRLRGKIPKGEDERAARFIYLTTLAFNGIYRVNQRGEFNVPYSGRTSIVNSARDDLGQYSDALQSAEIMSGDFEDALRGAGRSGALVYLDPPYSVAHGNNGFLKYNEKIFSWNDQLRLASVATELDRSGASVIISNAHNESIVKLYRRFRAIEVQRWSVMAASTARRVPIREYVFTNVG